MHVCIAAQPPRLNCSPTKLQMEKQDRDTHAMLALFQQESTRSSPEAVDAAGAEGGPFVLPSVTTAALPPASESVKEDGGDQEEGEDLETA